MSICQSNFFVDLDQRIHDIRVLFVNNFVFPFFLVLILWRLVEIWNISSLPIHNDLSRNIIVIWFSTLHKFSGFATVLLEEVISVIPFRNSIDIVDMFVLNLVENTLYILSRIRDFLSSDYTFHYLFLFSLIFIIHNSRAINQINSFGESNILPNFGLPRNWCNFAASLFHEGVNDGTLADIRISN